MISDKEVKSIGKSTFVVYEGRIRTYPEAKRVVRQNDNSLCTILSAMGSAQPVTTISHWDNQHPQQKKLK